MYDENSMTWPVSRSGSRKGKNRRRKDVAPGDPLAGPVLRSSLQRFSLVRKILFKDKADPETVIAGMPLREHLLTPTKIYVKEVLPVFREFTVKAAAHITGGGFDENIPRVLKEGQGAIINREALPEMPIFDFLRETGKLDPREMFNVFNMGIGMILIAAPAEAEDRPVS